jgi:CrcB protein
MTWLLVGIAGAIGAMARWSLDRLIMGRLLPTAAFPWGTLAINASGSLALGFVVGLGARALLSAPLVTVFGGGFIGAYTTFSTLVAESVALFARRAHLEAAWNLLGTVVIGALLAALGLWFAALA